MVPSRGRNQVRWCRLLIMCIRGGTSRFVELLYCFLYLSKPEQLSFRSHTRLPRLERMSQKGSANDERHSSPKSTDSLLNSSSSAKSTQRGTNAGALGRVHRVASRMAGAFRIAVSSRANSTKSASPMQSSWTMISEPHEYTWNPYAPPGAVNPAPSTTEVKGLFEEFHRWDEQKNIVSPGLWQRRVRLRAFRLFQQKKGDCKERYEEDVQQADAYTGDCLLDAYLFVECRFVHAGEWSAALGDDDRPAYKARYGFTMEEVMAVRGAGILIDAINKLGTLTAENNVLELHLMDIRAMINMLYDKLTDPRLGGQDERMYSKILLEEILGLKSRIDANFRRVQQESADRRDRKITEDAGLIRCAEEERRRLLRSQRRSWTGTRNP